MVITNIREIVCFIHVHADIHVRADIHVCAVNYFRADIMEYNPFSSMSTAEGSRNGPMYFSITPKTVLANGSPNR